METLASRESALPWAVTSELGRQADSRFEAATVPASAAASTPLPACPEFETRSHGDVLPCEATQRALVPTPASTIVAR